MGTPNIFKLFTEIHQSYKKQQTTNIQGHPHKRSTFDFAISITGKIWCDYNDYLWLKIQENNFIYIKYLYSFSWATDLPTIAFQKEHDSSML